MLRLNLMVEIGIFAALLFFMSVEFSNGIEEKNITFSIAPDDTNSVDIIHYKIDGLSYEMTNSEEVNYYLATVRSNKMVINYCVVERDRTCNNTKHYFYDSNEDSNIPYQSGLVWLLKTDILVYYPPQPDTYYMIDVVTFNFPSYSLYYNNAENLKVMFIVHQIFVGSTLLLEGVFNTYFVDQEDKCRVYRPKVITGVEMLNLNLFVNRKWTKDAYYFIKKDKYICAYSLNYEDMFRGAGGHAQEITPVNFQLIDTYPTENYAPNFFCIDPLYGTFVSLYWNHDVNTPPEAHYYIINEKDLKNIQLIGRMVLKEFKIGVLIDIFNNNFDDEYLPTFSSYGRQIFIWFKRPSETNRAFNGLWKNDEIREVYFQELTGDKNLKENYRTIWRAKKDYIQIDRPVGRLDVLSTPAPIPFTFPPAQAVTTLKPATITLPSTDIPSITAATSSSSPPFLTPTSTIDQSLSSSTSSSSEFTNTDSNDTHATPAPLIGTSAQPSSSDNDCSNGDLYLWLLIVIIVIDVIEAIILVILVIFKFRGAKKLKEAMARKKSLKSKSSIKKKPTPKTKPLQEKKTKIPWGKKKSIKEKSVTTKTEDAADGKSVAAAKKTTTTVDQTNYYTVGETFDKTKK